MRRLVALLLATWVCAAPCYSQNKFRDRFQERMEKRRLERTADGAAPQVISLAGLKVSVWEPPGKPVQESLPLVIFSHGFHGGANQSMELMQRIANAGYLVFAPNHEDARWGTKVVEPFGKPERWSAKTYSDRRDDVIHLLAALKADAVWGTRIDFSRIGLVGHSLGGYTVLGLDGGWPTWRMDGVKAVVAWSPYTNPLLEHGALAGVEAPVMFQTGTRDIPIRNYVLGPRGAYGATNPPKEVVEIDGGSHFAWTDLDHAAQRVNAIAFYTIAWLDKFVKGSPTADPTKTMPGATVKAALH